MAHQFVLDDEEADFSFADALASVDLEKDWDESKHPRVPAGSPGGGQFGEGGGDGGEETQIDHIIVNAGREYGLTPKESKALYSWSGDGYRKLRTDPSFGKVLEKLPLVNGKCWRGTRVTKDQLEKLKVGSVYKIDKFSSSSREREIAEAFSSPAQHEEKKIANVIFEIDDSARKIPTQFAELAGAGDEKEVVLMPGDRYKVTAVNPEVGQGMQMKFHVKMSQISA